MTYPAKNGQTAKPARFKLLQHVFVALNLPGNNFTKARPGRVTRTPLSAPVSLDRRTGSLDLDKGYARMVANESQTLERNRCVG